MRFTAGFLSGAIAGLWLGVGAALLVVAAIGRAVVLPDPMRVPNYVPESMTSDR